MTFSDYIDYLRGKRIGVIGFGVSNQPLVRAAGTSRKAVREESPGSAGQG